MGRLFPFLGILFFLYPLFSESPGEILSIEWEKRYTTEEIDQFVEPLFEGIQQPQSLYEVDVYWITYSSRYPDGEEALITAQLFIPLFERTKDRSVYVFGAGSTGLRDSCRPSREHILGIRWGLYRNHVLAHAGQGSIGLFPDYMGFGDPDRLQYYMVAQCEARVFLDGIRAVRNFIDEEEVRGIRSTSHFVAGFSQGGHAAFAAADYQKSYAPEVKLNGVIGFGPTTNILDLFREFSDIAPMVLYTYSELYGKDAVDPEEILLEKFSENLKRDLMRMCVGGMQSYYPQVPKGLFKEDFIDALLNYEVEEKYPLLYEKVSQNHTGLSGQTVPTVIFQGSHDIVIYPETQRKFADQLEELGVPLDYVFYENARHDTRQISFNDTRKWIENHTN